MHTPHVGKGCIGWAVISPYTYIHNSFFAVLQFSTHLVKVARKFLTRLYLSVKVSPSTFGTSGDVAVYSFMTFVSWIEMRDRIEAQEYGLHVCTVQNKCIYVCLYT